MNLTLAPIYVCLYFLISNWQVFDEADMLLCGSFQNKVIRLINLLRYDEKLLSRSKTSVSELPVTLESSLSSHDASEGEEEFPTEAMSDEEDDDNEDIANINNEAESVKKTRRDWRRVRKHFERSKQYVFVAATLPVNGKKTAGALLKHMFPDAEWVSGNYLHCHNPRCYIFPLFVLIINKTFNFLFYLVFSFCRGQQGHISTGTSN